MTDKFKNKYRIPSNRLQGFDYGSRAFYFVTICTKNKERYFGEIVKNVETAIYPHPNILIPNGDIQNVNTTKVESHNNASLLMTSIGIIAHKYWLDISNHYPFVSVDEFVIMPNHIHGILFLNPEDKTDWNPNTFGVQSKNLGAIIRGFKSSVKRYANINNIPFEWQPRYHDRIIRNESEYFAIKNYIIKNPENWKEDEMFK